MDQSLVPTTATSAAAGSSLPISKMGPRQPTEPKVRGSNPLGALLDLSAVGDFRPLANVQRWQHGWQRGNTDGVATRADRRAGRLPAWVEVRRGLPRRRPAAQAGGGDARGGARDQAGAGCGGAGGAAGPTLHAFALGWLDRYAGSGRDSVRENTRREYRRLLATFALRYFDRELRLRDLDRAAVQGFVDWLTSQPGRTGRLCDRSVANALTPVRAALDAAVAAGVLEQNPADGVVLPRRRGGRAWEFKERRFLTREELARLLDEVPPKWRSLFDLLAVTGCGSPRRSRCAGQTWSSIPVRRDCGSAARSSAAWSALRSRATARGPCRCHGSSRSPFALCGL
jgi:hypothetical protein